MEESRTPRPEPSAGDQLRACSMIYRQSTGPPSTAYWSIHPRSLAGFATGYVTWSIAHPRW